MKKSGYTKNILLKVAVVAGVMASGLPVCAEEFDIKTPNNTLTPIIIDGEENNKEENFSLFNVSNPNVIPNIETDNPLIVSVNNAFNNSQAISNQNVTNALANYFNSHDANKTVTVDNTSYETNENQGNNSSLTGNITTNESVQNKTSESTSPSAGLLGMPAKMQKTTVKAPLLSSDGNELIDVTVLIGEAGNIPLQIESGKTVLDLKTQVYNYLLENKPDIAEKYAPTAQYFYNDDNTELKYYTNDTVISSLTKANPFIITAGELTKQTETITNADAHDKAFSHRSSYGVRVNAGKTSDIYNSVFSKNTTSGIYADGSSWSNYATTAITDSIFSGNSATWGGAMYNGSWAKATITDSIFSGNSATQNGGAIYDSSYATATITNSIFSGNRATQDGGAIWAYYYGSVTITDSNFTNNSAVNGGAIYSRYYNTLNITDTDFINNTATTAGGAIWSDYTAYVKAVNKDVLFSGNKANGVSNAIHSTSSLYLTASAGRTITFKDAISGTGAIYINGDGTVKFEDNVTGTISISKGRLKIGADGVAMPSMGTLKLAGGELDVANSVYETITLSSLTANSKISLDMDFQNNQADKIEGGFDRSKAFYIGGFSKIINDFVGDSADIQISSTGITTLKSLIEGDVSGDCLYLFDASTVSDNGFVHVTRLAGKDSTLHDAIASASTEPQTYTLTNNILVYKDLGALQGKDLTVVGQDGKNISITNYNYKGITVNSGNKLTLKNIGAINAENEILASIKDFTTPFLNVRNGTINIDNVVFNNNSASSGGVIYSPDNSIIDIKNSKFIDNSATSNGGVIYINPQTSATSKLDIKDSIFSGNSATSYGGVIYAYSYKSGVSTNQEINITNTTFDGNTSEWGGVIYSYVNGSASAPSTLTQKIKDTTFKNNSAVYYGGAIYTTGTQYGQNTLEIENSIFDNNTVSRTGSYASVYGGAIYNSGATLTITDTDFTDNSVTASGSWAWAQGGGIYTKGTANITGGIFKNNSTTSGSASWASGGGIYTTGQTNITGTEFENNTSYSGGGIYSTGTTNITNGDFTSNSATWGGGIYSTGTTTITNGDFTSNTARYGGAIYVNSGTTTITDSIFTDNSTTSTGSSASAYGGAIYNSGSGTTLTITDTDFTNNSVTTSSWGSWAQGGAIYTTGTANITGGIFKNNSTTNTASGWASWAQGGGIYTTGQTDITGTTFENNTSYDGGGIYVGGGTTTITDGNFKDNTVSNDGAAIYVNSGTVNINNSNFNNNSGSSANKTWGGAISNKGTTTITDSDFISNKAWYGGAICANGGTTSIINSIFTDNSATSATTTTATTLGGAIYSTGTTNITDSDFTNNTVTATSTGTATSHYAYAYGGAIYNSGTTTITDSSFTNNSVTATAAAGTASALGGAIYNAGTLNIVANLEDVIFSGNTANAVSNAIHNTGTTNISGSVDHSVIFKDAITNTGTINIVGNFGKVIFENTLQGNIYINGGVLKLGKMGEALPTAGTLNLAGGTLDTTNNLFETTSINSLTTNSKVALDIDFVNNQNDKISGNFSNTQGFYISSLSNIISDFVGDSIDIKIADKGITTFRSLIEVSPDSDWLYSFEASNTSDNGIIHVNKILKDSSFYDAIEKVSDVPETYTLTKDVIAYKDSTTLNGVDLTVTGEGTDYTITGSGKGGINISVDKKLTLKDIASINNFAKPFLNINGGTVDTSNVLFTQNSAYNGGVIYANNNTTLNITDTSFTNNTASSNGGAIYSTSGTIDIDNSSFTGNTAIANGGTIYADNNVTLNIADTSFTNNTASSNGGAIYSISGTIDIDNSSFTGNTATANGGAVYNQGDLTINNGTFKDNRATAYGGAIYITSGTINIDDSEFSNNSGAEGGAIYNQGNLTINNGTFKDNRATGGGGAIHNKGTMIINDSIFQNNYANYGADIYNNAGTLTINNTSFSGSTSGNNRVLNNNGGTLTLNDIEFNDAKGHIIYGENTNTVNINAINKDADFTTTSGYNAIYNASNLNINANTEKNITFNSGVSVTSTFNINNDENKTGTVNFNSGVSASTINLSKGTVNFNASENQTIAISGTITAAADTIININNGDDKTGTLSINKALTSSGNVNLYNGTFKIDSYAVNNLNVFGGALDTNNNSIVTTAVKSINNDFTYNFDINFATAQSDLLNVTTIADSINMHIGKVNVLGVPDADSTRIQLINGNVNIIASDEYIYKADNYKYKLQAASGAAGYVDVIRTASTGLYDYYKGTVTPDDKTYHMDAYNETLTQDLGAIGVTELTIDGGESTKYNIDGKSHAGMNISSGQTLHIYNTEISNFSTSLKAGLIYNSGILDIDNSTIQNNKATNVTDGTSYGGAIYNTGTTTIKNSKIIGNSTPTASWSASHGGAIYNTGVLEILDSIFKNNSSQAGKWGWAEGGAIWNSGTLNITNTVFDNNSASNGSDSDRYGGAIYNWGTATIIDSIFTNNTATAYVYAWGGAIYNSRNLTIHAQNKDVLFDNNIATSTGHNDIENTGTMYLRADDGRTITFNDSITGSGSTYINNDQNTGTVIFNDTVAGNVYFYQGKLTLGTDGKAAKTINSLNVLGGTLDVLNNVIDKEVKINSVTGDLNLEFDLDLSNKTSDLLTGNFANGTKVKYSDINITGTMTDGFYTIQLATKGISTDGYNFDLGEDNYVYKILKSTTQDNGYITIVRGNRHGLAEAIQTYSDTPVTYTLSEDEMIITDIGQLRTDDFTIDGTENNYNVKSFDTVGIRVSAGQNLTLEDINNISGFKGANEGGFINNKGEVNIIVNENKTTTIDDAITGENGIININKDGTTGALQLNNTILGNDVNLYNGKLSIGKDGVAPTIDTLNIYGGSLSILNNALDTLNFGEITTYLNLEFDVDLTNGLSDILAGNISDGQKLNISKINLLHTNDVKATVKISDSNFDVATGFVATNDDIHKLYVNPIFENGTNLKITRVLKDGLFEAVHTTTPAPKTYNLVEQEQVIFDLGTLDENDLTVNGTDSHFGINADSVAGLFVGSDKKLTVENVGSKNSANTILDSVTGFTNSENGGFINNQGTLVLNNNIFKANHSDKNGGVIYNESSDVTLTGNTFSGNSANNGGAIYTTSDTQLDENTFVSNTSTENGGAVYGEKKVTINSGSFEQNNAKNGGAIYAKDADVTGTSFANNIATENGGAICGNGDIEITNSSFTENTATKDGGAVYGNGDINITDTSFSQNTSTENGGAIYSTVKLDISGNTAFNTNSAKNGGALYTAGTSTIVDASFANNTATENGGAIYNTGIVNITTENKDVLFNNNTDSSGSNAIYNKGTINLYTSEEKNITFNDSISGDGGIIEINKESGYSGSIFLNGNVTGNSVNIYNGKLVINDNGRRATVENLNVYGGTIDVLNNAIDALAFNSINSDLNIEMDVDLKNSISDYLTGNITAGQKVNITALNLINPDVRLGTVKISDVNLDVNAGFIDAKDGIHTFAVNALEGGTYLSMVRILKDGLYEALHRTSETPQTYTLVEREQLLYTLGTLDEINLTVDGTSSGRFGIDGTGFSNLTVGSDKTLTLKNLGKIDSNERISDSVFNFSSETNGGFLNNSGALSISDSVFQNNHSDKNGGAIYNDSESPLQINKTTFIGNSADFSGGAISTKSQVNITDSNFINNISNSLGGAIFADGNINIYAQNSDVMFKGNRDVSGLNAIYNSGKSISLNANSGRKITFNDGITGNGIIDINNEAGKTGTIVINSNVSSTNTVNLHNGILQLGADGTAAPDVKLNILGGMLSLSNGIIDGNVKINSITGDLNLLFDVDLKNSLSDIITAGIEDGQKLNIKALNFINNDITSGTVKISDFNLVVNEGKVESFDGKDIYLISKVTPEPESTGTYINILYSGLYSALHRTASGAQTYTLNSDESVICNLENMETMNLTIDGTTDNTYKINANGFSGITMDYGKTLTIKNIGDVSGFGDTFIKDTAASLTVQNSKFTNNTGTNGGVISGQSQYVEFEPEWGWGEWFSPSINISNSIFEDNTSTADGGAIYYYAQGWGWGGGLYINNTTFSNNRSNQDGGAIYFNAESDGTSLSIQNSIFEGNTSEGNGGALSSPYGYYNITDTSFIDNTASGRGGAIYNTGGLSITAQTKDVLFSGNSDSEGANAIYNSYGQIWSYSSGTNKVIFDDPIVSQGGYFWANGNTVFNADVTGFDRVCLQGGTLSLGSDGTAAPQVDNLWISSGTLDIQNNIIDSTYIYSDGYVYGTANFQIDVDLKNKTSDKINSSNSYIYGAVSISSINLLPTEDLDTDSVNIPFFSGYQFGNSSSSLVVDSPIEDSIYKYLISTSGNTLSVYRGLKHGLSEKLTLGPDVSTIYTMPANEVIIDRVTDMTTKSLVVDGTTNHYTINAGGSSRINIGERNILAIKDVGKLYNFGGQTTTDWGDTIISGNGVFYNRGRLSIDNTSITNNNISQDAIITNDSGSLDINKSTIGSITDTYYYESSSLSIIKNILGDVNITNSNINNNVQYMAYLTVLDNNGGTMNISDSNIQNNSVSDWTPLVVISNTNNGEVNLYNTKIQNNSHGNPWDAMSCSLITNNAVMNIFDSDIINNTQNGTEWSSGLNIISNTDTLTIQNTDIQNNNLYTRQGTPADSYLINNANGAILNIFADKGSTNISNNNIINSYDGTSQNYEIKNSGTMNIAAKGFSDNITISENVTGNGTININNESSDGTANEGIVTFNNNVAASSVNLYNGTLQLGSSDGTTNIAAPEISSLNVNGGKLSLVNNLATDNTGIASVADSTVLNLSLDVDFANITDDISASDKVSINSGSKIISIDNINMLSDIVGSSAKIKISDTDVQTLRKLILTTDYKYLFNESDTGTIVVDKALSHGIYDAIHASEDEITYNLNAYDNIIFDLGTLEDNKLIVKGDGQYSIGGNSHQGITVSENQTLIIDNVGSVNADGTVAASISGFNTKDTSGSFVNNKGNLNITNTVFNNNNASVAEYASGGVIENENTGIVQITNSTFVENSAADNGGAIDNNGGTLNITGSTFTSNTATSKGGGAISDINNTDAGTIIIKSSTFKENETTADGGAILWDGGNTLTSEQNTFTANSALNGGAIHSNNDSVLSNNVFTQNSATKDGGAIYNSDDMEIDNSSFGENTAVNGAAIYNNGTLTISDTSFTNNVATGKGGAIYNKADLTLLVYNQDIKFTGNKVNDISNAIYNESTLNLNAQLNKNIIFEDKIDGSDGVININKDITDGDNVLSHEGTIVFNNTVENNTVNLYNGNLKLLKDGNITEPLNILGGNLILDNNDFTSASLGTLSGGKITLTNSSTMTIVNSVADAQVALEIADNDSHFNIVGENTTFTTNTGTVINQGNITVGNGTDASVFNFSNASMIGGTIEVKENSIMNMADNTLSGGNIVNSGTINLSAKDNSKIFTVNSKITGTLGIINLNQDAEGIIKLTRNITGNTVNLHNGTLQLGLTTSDIPTLANIDNLNILGGTLDIQNNNIDIVSINSITSPLNIKFDIDLATKTGEFSASDSITGDFAEFASVNLDENNINFISQLTESQHTKVKLADKNIVISDALINSNQYKYLFYGADDAGTVDIIRGLKNGLKEAINSSAITSYNVETNNRDFHTEQIVQNIGNIEADNFTIDGGNNNASISGNNFGGIIVGSNKDLTVKNVKINGFKGENGSFIENSGYLKTDNVKFENNIATGDGGVISNTNEATIENSNFTSNTANNGGAIYNTGIATFTNTSFENNTANDDGGAIWNNGTVTISANNGTSNFDGNNAGTESNAIYNEGTVNLVAYNTYDKINFNDKINGNDAGIININKDETGIMADRYKGTVVFNNNVEDVAVNLYSGTLQLGSSSSDTGTSAVPAPSISNLNIYGGTLNLANTITADNVSINSIADGSVLKLILDIDFANTDADGISASDRISIHGDTNKDVKITGFNLLSELEGNFAKIKISDTPVHSLEQIVYDTLHKYCLNESTTGIIDIYKNYSRGLYDAMRDGGDDILYNITEHDNIPDDLGDLQDKKLTVTGNNVYDIRGNNYTGMKVSDGRTLYLQNVGSIDGNGIIVASINGFANSFIQNSGFVEISNSVFYNNHSTDNGGVINNIGGSLNISNSTFDNNKSDKNGASIYSDGGTVNIYNSVFQNNACADGIVAFKNAGNYTITDTSFNNNTGVAISTSDGAILSINTNDKSLVFSGNTSDLYNITNSAVGINTNKNTTITFNGNIIGDGTGVIDINKDNSEAGTIIFNNNVSNQQSVNLYNGTLQLGSKEDVTSGINENTSAPNIDNLNINGGTLDIANNIAADNVTITSIAETKALNLIFDIDFANTDEFGVSASDKVLIKGTNNEIRFTDFNIISDLIGDTGEIRISDSAVTTHEQVFYKGDRKYVLSAAEESLIKINGGLAKGLYEAVHAGQDDVTYSLVTNDTMAQNLGNLEDKLLTIKGDGQYNINGKNFSGLNVDNDRTLIIENVGSLNDDGSIKAAINGFSAENGGFINNNGTTNITNSVFTKNNANNSGVIANNNTATITGSIFTDNTAQNASVITNSGTMDISESKFNNNIANVNGGAIVNKSNMTLTDNTFENNNANEKGGAILNEAGAVLTLAGTNEFKDNIAKGHKNDIHNNGIINITGTGVFDGGINGTGILNLHPDAKADFSKGELDQRTITMANNSYLNISNENEENLSEISVHTGETANISLDYSDTLNSNVENAGTLQVQSIDLQNKTFDEETITDTMADNIKIDENTVLLKSDKINYFKVVKTDTKLSIQAKEDISLNNAITHSDNNQFSVYNMHNDEKIDTANHVKGVNDSRFIVNGNGNSIIDGSIIVESGTNYESIDTNYKNCKTSADEGAKAAITVKPKATVNLVAMNHDVAILNTDNHTAISMESDNDEFSAVTFVANDGKVITINDDIVSDNKGNTVSFNGNIVANGMIDPVTVNVSAGTLVRNNYDDDVTYNLNKGGTLYYSNDDYVYNSNIHNSNTYNLNSVNFNGGALDLRNFGTHTVGFDHLNISDSSNIYVDADLKAEKMDTLFANSVSAEKNAKLHVAGINLLTDTVKPSVNINFTKDNKLKEIVDYTGEQGIAYSPIYQYNVGYNSKTGDFSFTKRGDGFNPALKASSAATQMAFLNQVNTYDEAFANMDMIMLLPESERNLIKANNKYAAATDSNEKPAYTYNSIHDENKGIWFKPFATLEKVSLNDGPSVRNNAYGALVGGDSSPIELKNGWNAIYSVYAGYNGSNQNYDGIDITQNGGLAGATGVFYKGKFFTGVTANVGASQADASTMFGRDDFTMLTTGIASKTGYNFEFFNGKFIVQPNWLMSYSMINTFKHASAAGVDIDTAPLHAIQLTPGLKMTGNLPHGWKPYAMVQMVWNLMDKTQFAVQDISLPQMSVDPYIQYGVGVQKQIGERLTGSLQATFRNGGRNGLSFSANFKYELGK